MGTDFEMSPIIAVFLLLLLSIDLEVEGNDCCEEKKVGSVSYTLHQPHSHSLSEQCLDNCVYTILGSTTPKYCFQQGDLPTECLSDTTTTTTTTPRTTPTTSSSVEVTVEVRDDRTEDLLTAASVQLTLGDETMNATTGSDGRATFALSANSAGKEAKIKVSAAGYTTSNSQKIISPGQNNVAMIYLV